MLLLLPRSTLFPYTTLFRSAFRVFKKLLGEKYDSPADRIYVILDRKSTRLNSSHVSISYAVFCLKKKIRRELCTYAAVTCSRACHTRECARSIVVAKACLKW